MGKKQVVRILIVMPDKNKIKKYQISGGDDDTCYGPSFGPVIAEEITKINNYIVLKLTEAMKIKNDIIEFILVSPRYEGDTVDVIRLSGGIVGIWRVLPGKENDIKLGISKKNTQYWAIGECKPIKA